MKKTIFYFLLLQPVLDILISLQQRYLPNTLSIGLIIRGVLFLTIFIYLFKNKNNRKYLISYLIFLFIYLLYDIFIIGHVITELSNIFQIFYLPFLILFFSEYEDKKISKNFILIISFILLNTLVIPYIFGWGFNISEQYVNKDGFIGFYNGGNEISAIILCLLPISLTYLKDKKLYLKIIYIIEYLVCTIIIGTKVLFLGTILICAYLITKSLLIHKRINGKTITITIIILLLIAFIIPYTPIYKNYITSTDYYNIDSIDDIVKEDNIDNIIFSKRLSNAKNIKKEYKKSNLINKLLGIGRSRILSIKDIEIDILDIFYSIGIVGTIYYLLLLFNIIKNTRIYSMYKITFILMILISCFSGHILFKPQVSIYLALLFFLNKYDENYYKKRILLVSNMYPSKKNKHYGSFVKNVYNLLKDNNFIINKITMNKHSNKIIKLLAYLKLHLKTIIYGTLGCYDYIYVHFISHSSLGAVIVKKLKPNIKLVLNAHGNDVVADYDFEEKNILRSKKYLKEADLVIVPSKYYKKVMINNYDIDEDLIKIYPSGGVNTKLFIPKDKIEAKKGANLDPDMNYIGYISRIEKNKGYDTFIEAINELNNKKLVSNTKFIIVGKGDEEPILNELIEKYKLNDLIIKKDMVLQKELVDIYNSLDLFIFPTYRKSESLGLVGLEAMSCKIPVLAAENYGPTDYIVNNKNGFFFKPQDSKTLSKKIISILKRKDLNTILDNARLKAIEYDVENTKNEIISIFNNIN